MTYPDPSAPTIQPVRDHLVRNTMPFTGSHSTSLLLVAAVVIGVGLILWGIARVGRRHV